MRLTTSRILAISVSLLIFSGAALADNCANFSTYSCAKSSPALARIGGGTSDGGLGVGFVLNSNTFDVYTTNGQGGPDVIIVAAFTTAAPKGSLNGIFFSSLGGLPMANGNTGAITSSLLALGLCSGSCPLSFGFVDLGTALAKNGTVSVTASGVPAGTVFFAEVLNAKGQICYMTPFSEGAIMGKNSESAVPEPGSLALLGTGLIGLATQIRRKLRS